LLTDGQLSDFAKEYMRNLGYGDQPYLVSKLTDFDGHLFHFVGLRLDETGKPLIDQFEHRPSRQLTRELKQNSTLHLADRRDRAEGTEL